MRCRFCNTELKFKFLDLNSAPPSNSFLTKEQLDKPEAFYPLKIFVCEKCFLVQLKEHKKSHDIFSDSYAYYSFSSSWLEYSRLYVNMITEKFNYNQDSHIIEIASNDGYLLQYFKNRNIPVLGIEPAANVAEAAKKKGIDTITEFFGKKLATELVSKNKKANLIIGNNVFAYVPDVNDFVSGIKIALKGNGVVTLEFPHLMQLIEQNQFDTIYHEHYSYFSFYTSCKIFEQHALEIFDLEQIHTHGGSLRIYGKHKEDKSKNISNNVIFLLQEEKDKGLQSIGYYRGFEQKVGKVKTDLLDFLLQQKKQKKKVAAYGAAAKGNTLLNYCGIKNDLIDFVVDASPHKQGKYLRGSHIPIVDEKILKKEKPDYILILPWNLKDEIMLQLKYVTNWNAKFVLPIPTLQII
ncbi:MAG: class I SAM-dependent methyltransferase [Bacteroidales bacterium]|nr:class I SAM-dependent methyltransferase [Bacteroidales bacterium]